MNFEDFQKQAEEKERILNQERARREAEEEKTKKAQQIDHLFKSNLPDTMYFSHYELSKMYGFSPTDWRQYLRDNHLFIETELAAIAEAEARAALSRLSNASGAEVAALKTLLEKSKLINDAQRQQTKVMLTFLNPTEER